MKKTKIEITIESDENFNDFKINTSGELSQSAIGGLVPRQQSFLPRLRVLKLLFQPGDIVVQLG